MGSPSIGNNEVGLLLGSPFFYVGDAPSFFYRVGEHERLDLLQTGRLINLHQPELPRQLVNELLTIFINDHVASLPEILVRELFNGMLFQLVSL